MEHLKTSEGDGRHITFVVDTQGGVGKSALAKNLQFLIPDKEVFSITPQNVKTLANLYPEDGCDVFAIDCPRYQQCNDVPCGFLENVLDGEVANEKCQCQKKEFKPPHLVVFMNRLPKTGDSILSRDRCTFEEVRPQPGESDKIKTADETIMAPHLGVRLDRSREIIDGCDARKIERNESQHPVVAPMFTEKPPMDTLRKKTNERFKRTPTNHPDNAFQNVWACVEETCGDYAEDDEPK